MAGHDYPFEELGDLFADGVLLIRLPRGRRVDATRGWPEAAEILRGPHLRGTWQRRAANEAPAAPQPAATRTIVPAQRSSPRDWGSEMCSRSTATASRTVTAG